MSPKSSAQQWGQEEVWKGFIYTIPNRCTIYGNNTKVLLCKHSFRTSLSPLLTPRLLTKWQPPSLSHRDILELLLMEGSVPREVTKSQV